MGKGDPLDRLWNPFWRKGDGGPLVGKVWKSGAPFLASHCRGGPPLKCGGRWFHRSSLSLFEELGRPWLKRAPVERYEGYLELEAGFQEAEPFDPLLVLTCFASMGSLSPRMALEERPEVVGKNSVETALGGAEALKEGLPKAPAFEQTPTGFC